MWPPVSGRHRILWSGALAIFRITLPLTHLTHHPRADSVEMTRKRLAPFPVVRRGVWRYTLQADAMASYSGDRGRDKVGQPGIPPIAPLNIV